MSLPMIFQLIQDFHFNWNDAPLNSLNYVVITSITYVCIVLLYAQFNVIKAVMEIQNTQPFVTVHNLILCVSSLIMFLGVGYEIINRSYRENSIEWIFCEHPSTQAKGMLWFWSYMYYISKYYELLDTLFQFLAGKTPPNFFLHVYHHSLVILRSWAWIETQASTQFIGILFNAAVHVIMYYYFYLKSIGISPSWKSYVTKFQIVQFLFSLLVVTICYGYAAQRYQLHNHPVALSADSNNVQYSMCKGMHVLTGTLLFNITLLFGFFGVLNKKSDNNNSDSKQQQQRRTKKE